MKVPPAGRLYLLSFVNKGQLRFTSTGGYWSDFFYKDILLPLSSEENLQLLPCFLDTGDIKDLNQFKIWCKVNNLAGVIYQNTNDVPPSVLEVDYSNINERLFGDIMKRFYDYLEYQMTNLDVSESIPQAILCRDTTMAIRRLVDNDVMEDEPFVNGEPGPGFKWLKTGSYEKQSIKIFGGQTTRDYIDDMSRSVYTDNVLYPELLFNKRSVDFNIAYSVGMTIVGQVPAKRRTAVSVNYPYEAEIPVADYEARQFFSGCEMVDTYGFPAMCLENEYKSVAKFCPCAHASSYIHKCKFDNILYAFNYCVSDWNIGGACLMDLSEVARLRNWNTSPGYPYNRYGLTNGRDAFDKYYGLIKHTMEWAKFDWMPTMFNVFLKDEVLKIDKVHNNDVRTIIAPSLCGQLISQVCTMDLSNKVATNFRNSHTQIGRTRFRGDVHRTGVRCTKFQNIEEYDIKKWDRSVKAILMKLFWYYCWLVLDTDDRGVFFQLANVFESSVYSHMVHQSGEVVRKKYGIPSGFTLTSYANSWIHTFLNILMFCELCPFLPSDPDDIKNLIKENMDFVCYGDDGLMTYTDMVKDWFHPSIRSAWLRRIFDMDLPIENVKMVDSLYMEPTSVGDVDGITFLGDILWPKDGYIVPVFKMSKVINTIIYPGKKNYTPAERVLIAFGHYVECFFHPKSEILYKWLLYLLDKYKDIKVTSVMRKSEIVDFLGFTNNEMIQLLVLNAVDKEKLDVFVFDRFYKDATVCPET